MLTLGLANIYSWQLSNSCHYLTIKIHPYISEILQISFTVFLQILQVLLQILQFISNISQEPHYFLIFRDLVTTYISSRNSQPNFPRKKHWRTFSWPGERPCWKLLKWYLVYLLNPLADFCCWDGISCLI